MLDDCASAVFWECHDGEEALYRHLRSLNTVKIPREKVDIPADGTEAPHEPDDGYETVVFRHADANVMAQILPALYAANFARVIGRARTILFSPDAQWSELHPEPFVASRRDVPAVVRTTPLILDKATVDRIEDQRRKAVVRENRLFVSRHLPPELKSMRLEDIDGFVEDGLAGAAAFSIREKAAVQRWSYMSVVTRGAINRDDKVRRFMTSETFGASPDGKTKQLMDAFIHGLRKNA